MKLAIMQPYSFPYLGYFQLINVVDKFLVLDDVNFISKGWINRNYILVNGKSYLFTFPCEKISVNKKIVNTNILLTEEVKKKFLKTIEYSYKKAPNFLDVINLIELIIYKESKTIADFAETSIKTISNYLGIKTKFGRTSKKYSELKSKGSDRIIEICKKENCTEYINAIGGNKLYKKEDFKKEAIELFFLKSNPIKYKQFNNQFVPNLSIIDVLMFNKKEKVREMLDEYKLVEQ